MRTPAESQHANRHRPIEDKDWLKVGKANSALKFRDNRPEAVSRKQLRQAASNSARVQQRRVFQGLSQKSREGRQIAQLKVNATNRSPVIQRTPAAANNYAPNPGVALHYNFFMHHTARGRHFNNAQAITNHETRALSGDNTTVDMTARDAANEIFDYLAALSPVASANLVNNHQINFTTNQRYYFIVTAWNGGSPQVIRNGLAQLQVTMGWVNDVNLFNGGYYQLYHLDGM